ncbi:DNA alkylation repair protein [uncultured Thomasclavelia sp.]|uniref:DNA alkylation repair protein n=1 Tax=uncultured Thomasclavelia sp. TaxID=3025759 RepID=UPI0025D223A6|nr:DNA alkylation repair protein [uncultured Thomasclavelia sp.]
MEKYQQLKELFESNRDDQNAQKMAKYMRNLFKFYGIATPKRKAICRDILKQEKKNRVIDWQFLDYCYQDDYRELQYFVGDYLKAMQKYLTYDDIDHLKQYIQTKQWWDTTDFFDQIIGKIGLQDQRVANLMLQWSLDEDFWLRRIAIDHQLLRKDKTDTQLLETIIVNNLNSNEFFINKAIGWSLRDYSKTNPDWVRSFIAKYHDNLSSLSIKEASKYL